MEITTSGTRAVFKDDLGQPLIGGKVYTYVMGTSTPKDAYRTAKLAAPHTNPIILDDAGSSELYLDGGYKLRVYDLNDVFVDEVDNIYQGDAGFHIKPDGLNYENFYNSVTTDAPNVTISADGSLRRSDDATNAATRKVGKLAGNVVEVGEFGVGLYKNAMVSPDTFKRSTFEGFYSATDPLHNDIRAYITSAYSNDWVWQQRCAISSSGVGSPEFRLFYNGAAWSIWHKYLTTANTVQDTSGLFKNTNSVIGRLGVASIAAGVGAPALAYKKFAGVTAIGGLSVNIAHGLNAADILSVSVTVLTSAGNYVSEGSSNDVGIIYHHHTASNIVITTPTSGQLVQNRAFKVLITYEV